MAGLLGSIFDPSFYENGAQGLLSRLQPMLNAIPQSAGFPQQAAQPDTNPIAVGNYQMPRVGNPDQFQPQQVNIPPAAQPAQGQMPQQSPGFFDRLNAGFQSIGNGGSLIGAATGNYTDVPNQTQKFLVSRGFDPGLAKAVTSDPRLLQAVLPQVLGIGGQTDDIKEYRFAKMEDPSLTFEKFMARKRATTGEYGLNYVYGIDEKTGKTVAFAPGKSGVPKQVEFPDGIKLASGLDTQDTGTHLITRDKRTGQVLSVEKKNIEEKEAAEKVGAARGTAKVALPAAETTTGRAVKMLDELEKHPGFSDGVGFIVGRLPALTPKAADFRERVEQIDAMVFGDAVEVMRGLGALTDKEGPRITAARARLKTAKSEEDFRTALKDIREVFKDGIENMRKKAGQSSEAPATTSPAVVDYRTYFGNK